MENVTFSTGSPPPNANQYHQRDQGYTPTSYGSQPYVSGLRVGNLSATMFELSFELESDPVLNPLKASLQPEQNQENGPSVYAPAHIGNIDERRTISISSNVANTTAKPLRSPLTSSHDARNEDEGNYHSGSKRTRRDSNSSFLSSSTSNTSMFSEYNDDVSFTNDFSKSHDDIDGDENDAGNGVTEPSEESSPEPSITDTLRQKFPNVPQQAVCNNQLHREQQKFQSLSSNKRLRGADQHRKEENEDNSGVNCMELFHQKEHQENGRDDRMIKARDKQTVTDHLEKQQNIGITIVGMSSQQHYNEINKKDLNLIETCEAPVVLGGDYRNDARTTYQKEARQQQDELSLKKQSRIELRKHNQQSERKGLQEHDNDASDTSDRSPEPVLISEELRRAAEESIEIAMLERLQQSIMRAEEHELLEKYEESIREQESREQMEEHNRRLEELEMEMFERLTRSINEAGRRENEQQKELLKRKLLEDKRERKERLEELREKHKRLRAELGLLDATEEVQPHGVVNGSVANTRDHPATEERLESSTEHFSHLYEPSETQGVVRKSNEGLNSEEREENDQRLETCMQQPLPQHPTNQVVRHNDILKEKNQALQEQPEDIENYQRKRPKIIHNKLDLLEQHDLDPPALRRTNHDQEPGFQLETTPRSQFFQLPELHNIWTKSMDHPLLCDKDRWSDMDDYDLAQNMKTLEDEADFLYCGCNPNRRVRRFQTECSERSLDSEILGLEPHSLSGEIFARSTKIVPRTLDGTAEFLSVATIQQGFLVQFHEKYPKQMKLALHVRYLNPTSLLLEFCGPKSCVDRARKEFKVWLTNRILFYKYDRIKQQGQDQLICLSLKSPLGASIDLVPNVGLTISVSPMYPDGQLARALPSLREAEHGAIVVRIDGKSCKTLEDYEEIKAACARKNRKLRLLLRFLRDKDVIPPRSGSCTLEDAISGLQSSNQNRQQQKYNWLLPSKSQQSKALIANSNSTPLASAGEAADFVNNGQCLTTASSIDAACNSGVDFSSLLYEARTNRKDQQCKKVKANRMNKSSGKTDSADLFVGESATQKNAVGGKSPLDKVDISNTIREKTMTLNSKLSKNRSVSDSLINTGLQKDAKQNPCFESFNLKVRDIFAIEFKDTSMKTLSVITAIWKKHKQLYASCDDKCQCFHNLPSLTLAAVEKYTELADKARRRIQLIDGMYPVGLAGNFAGLFVPLLTKEYPGEVGSNILKRLLKMWKIHCAKDDYGITCSKACVCKDGWETVFQRGHSMLDPIPIASRRSSENDLPTKRNEDWIIPRKPQAIVRSESIGSGQIHSNVCKTTSSTSMEDSWKNREFATSKENTQSMGIPRKVPKQQRSTSSIIQQLEASITKIDKSQTVSTTNPTFAEYEVLFTSHKALGFYFVTDVDESGDYCRVASVSLFCKQVDDRRIQAGTKVLCTSTDTSSGNWLEVHTHHDLKEQFQAARRSLSNIVLRFVNNHVTESSIAQSNVTKRKDWTVKGQWSGKDTSGWDGGAAFIEPQNAIHPSIEIVASKKRTQGTSSNNIDSTSANDTAEVLWIEIDQPRLLVNTGSNSLLQKSVKKKVSKKQRIIRFTESFEWRYYTIGSLPSRFLIKSNNLDEFSITKPDNPTVPDSGTNELSNIIHYGTCEDMIHYFQLGALANTQSSDELNRLVREIKDEQVKIEKQLTTSNDVDLLARKEDLKYKTIVLKVYINTFYVATHALALKQWERFEIVVKKIQGLELSPIIMVKPGSMIQSDVSVVYSNPEKLPSLPEMPVLPTVDFGSNTPHYLINHNPSLTADRAIEISLTMVNRDEEKTCLGTLEFFLSKLHSECPHSRDWVEVTVVCASNDYIRNAKLVVFARRVDLDPPDYLKIKRNSICHKLSNVIEWIERFNIDMSKRSTTLDSHDLSFSADVRVTDNISLLHSAILLKQVHSVKKLLKLGANPFAKSKIGSALSVVKNMTDGVGPSNTPVDDDDDDEENVNHDGITSQHPRQSTQILAGFVSPTRNNNNLNERVENREIHEQILDLLLGKTEKSTTVVS